jgi:molecular chaperone Hsp33
MTQGDSLQRFVFEGAAVRGAIVQLDAAWRATLERREYPEPVAHLLGETMAASALLTSSLKFDGALILQIQGAGPLKLLVAECAADLAVRATATWREPLHGAGLDALVGDGRFVITLDPKTGGEAYQGIVAVEGASVEAALEHYMRQSEQIQTRLWLAADRARAAGLMLQQLPGAASHDPDVWTRVGMLADTLTDPELLRLDAGTLIRRLFHEEDVRVFDTERVTFRCSCAREKVAAMLRMLGRDEVRSIVAERGDVEVGCDFCGRRYVFDRVDAEQLFAADPALGAPSSGAVQ